MRALVLSDVSRLAEDIHIHLLDRGHESVYITTRKTNVANGFKIDWLEDRLVWFKNAIRSFFYRMIILRASEEFGYYQDISENKHYYKLSKFKKHLKNNPDVIFILFDYRLLTMATVRGLFEYTSAPVFFLLPDMRLFTGGCSYSFECMGYQKNCEQCPAIKRASRNKFAELTLHKKIQHLKHIDHNVITFSEEQFLQAKSSKLFSSSNVLKTYFPLDYSIFKASSKLEVRKELGLPLNKRIIMFGAANIMEYRKGFQYIRGVMEELSNHDSEMNIYFLIVGDSGEIAKQFHDICSLKSYSFVNFEKLAKLYQASDFFLSPTIADSGPTMVNQSILCGTPVVSFEVGVAIDLVRDGKTGFLVSSKVTKAYVDTVFKAINLSNQRIDELSVNCKNLSEEIKANDLFSKIDSLLVKND